MGLLDTSQILRPELHTSNLVTRSITSESSGRTFSQLVARSSSGTVQDKWVEFASIKHRKKCTRDTQFSTLSTTATTPPPHPHTTTAAAVTRHRVHRRHHHHHYHRLHTTATATTTTMCFFVSASVVCFSVSLFAFFFSIRCHSRRLCYLSKFGVKGPIGNFKHMFSSARALNFISISQRWTTPKSTGISSKYTINGWMIACSIQDRRIGLTLSLWDSQCLTTERIGLHSLTIPYTQVRIWGKRHLKIVASQSPTLFGQKHCG